VRRYFDRLRSHSTRKKGILVHRGFVKIHRKILEGIVFSDAVAFHLFMYIVLSANHKQGFAYGQKVEIGQLLTGRKVLAEVIKKSESGVEKILKRLVKYKLITQKSNNKHRIITVLNWSKLAEFDSRVTTKCQQSNNKVTTKCQQGDTNNNDNNGNNEKNDNNTYAFFQNAWNDSMPIKIIKLSDNRKKKIKSRLKKDTDFETHFKICLQKINDSDFLSGRKGEWKASFDWLIENDNNYMKVLEDNYKNNKAKSSAERNLENARRAIEKINNN